MQLPQRVGSTCLSVGFSTLKEAKWPVRTQGPLSRPLWEDTAVLDRVPSL